MGKYRYNRYRDLEIDISRLSFTDELSFSDCIRREHDTWSRKLRGSLDSDTAVFWLNVPRSVAHVVPWIVNMGPSYIIHHANTKRIMFVRPNNPGTAEIPAYGTHYVKVECVVIERETNNLLVVRERVGSPSATFKLVTGSVDAGEFIADAAIREVFEETKIRCHFINVIGCGNRLRTRFDRDEIIVGCLLYAERGQQPSANGAEISCTTWLSIPNVLAQCSPMSREWILAATVSDRVELERTRTVDIFRGAPYTMDFFIPRKKVT